MCFFISIFEPLLKSLVHSQNSSIHINIRNLTTIYAWIYDIWVSILLAHQHSTFGKLFIRWLEIHSEFMDLVFLFIHTYGWKSILSLRTLYFFSFTLFYFLDYLDYLFINRFWLHSSTQYTEVRTFGDKIFLTISKGLCIYWLPHEYLLCVTNKNWHIFSFFALPSHNHPFLAIWNNFGL